MSKHTPIPVRRPHVADGFPHVGDVAPTYATPHVGGVAPTYDIPVGRPHVADGFSCVGGAAPTHSHACRIYLTCMLTASSLHT